MTTWQGTPGTGFHPGQQGYPQQNPGYPPQQGYNQGYPYGTDQPNPLFVPPPGGPPYGQVPPTGPPYGLIPPPGPAFGTAPQPDMYRTDYLENPMPYEPKGFSFGDKTIRNGFIRKVYSILMCQLLITVSLIALFLYHQPTKLWVVRHPELFWIAFGLVIALIICMSCCTSARRKSPMNFILLFTFTIAEGFLLAIAASRYSSEEVLMAAGITTVVCLALTLFAFQTKIDFTAMNGILFVALIIFILFGIIAAIWHDKVVSLVYSCLGALLFSVYLIYDTQRMIGGNHENEISPEEYIFAALSLYLDVIQIFLHILAIIGRSRE